MNQSRNLVFVSILAATLLILLLRTKPSGAGQSTPAQPLVIFCAAGVKPPVETVAKDYEKAYGTPVQIQYGGSGTLLSNLRVSGIGDLFIAADDSYIRLAETHALIAETIPLARMTLVIAVAKGNPKNIRTFEDLYRVNVALANPDAAAIGKVTRDLLKPTGHWTRLENHTRVFKPTVNDVANDVTLGAVDAGIVWDATISQYERLEGIRVEPLSSARQNISVAVLRSTKQPVKALHFARYMAAMDRGLQSFARHGYSPVEGDAWSEHPEVLLFSGGINRLAIEETLRQFEEREGARITRVYNGCGILVAQMKAGQNPDAYFACDTSFMAEVQDRFEAPVTIARNDVVILVQKDNPRSIVQLSDLGEPGIKLGIANESQSALGALTTRLLKSTGLQEKVMSNVRVQTPTADLLVNQMRAGALDAAIVYQANANTVKDLMKVIPIENPLAFATQPFAIGKTSSHRFLTERLLLAISSEASRTRFESAGFQWKVAGTRTGAP